MAIEEFDYDSDDNGMKVLVASRQQMHLKKKKKIRISLLRFVLSSTYPPQPSSKRNTYKYHTKCIHIYHVVLIIRTI